MINQEDPVIQRRRQREAEAKRPLSPAEAEAVRDFVKIRCAKVYRDISEAAAAAGVVPHRLHHVFALLSREPSISIRFVNGVNMVKFNGGLKL